MRHRMRAARVTLLVAMAGHLTRTPMAGVRTNTISRMLLTLAAMAVATKAEVRITQK